MATTRWGILAPGRIARAFAVGLQEAEAAELVAVGSRSADRAAAFAAEFGAARAYGSYAELAADPAVDAVYVASPHAGHQEHGLLCLRAGKHVLCEKPLAVNAAQAGRMIAAAEEAGVVLMEAVWTRFLPTLVRTRELVAAGAVGEVRMVQADFGFRAEFAPQSRLFAPELAGGALLDVGIYPVNLAVMLLGEPEEILTTANLGATGVDEEAAMILRHPGGRLAVLGCALRLDTPRAAHILGTAGRLVIAHPWWAGTRLEHHRGDGAVEVIDLPHRGGGYTHEIEAFQDLIRNGDRGGGAMPLAESLAVLRTLDAVRARWGLRYPCE